MPMAKTEATWPAATSLHSGDVEWSRVQSHGEHFTHSRQEAAEQGTTLCDRARENPQARPEGLGVPQWHSDGLTEKSITGQPEQLERLPVSGTQSSLINAESGKDLWLRTLWPETQRSTAHSRLPQPGDHLVTVQTENFCLGQMIRQVGRQECRCNSRQTRT